MIHKKVFEYIMENFMGNCTDACPASKLCENGRPVCDELTEIVDNQGNCFAEEDEVVDCEDYVEK